MAKADITKTVHVVPREGLNFPPDEVHPVDVDPDTAAALLATGAYVVADDATQPAAAAVKEDTGDGAG